MNNLKSFGIILMLSVSMAFFTACGDGAERTDETSTEATVHGEGPEYTSEYVCPMHCTGSGSAEPGKCPVCGMTYEKLEDHTKNNHKH